jgi:hypothetical protein
MKKAQSPYVAKPRNHPMTPAPPTIPGKTPKHQSPFTKRK